MPRSPKQIIITYEDLANVTGKSMASIYQDVSSAGEERVGFDPDDFPSIIRYIAHFGTEETKLMILKAIISPSGKALRNPAKVPKIARTPRSRKRQNRSNK